MIVRSRQEFEGIQSANAFARRAAEAGPFGRSLLRSCIVVIFVAAGCGQQLMPTPNIYVGSTQDCFDDVPEAHRSNQVELVYVTDRAPEGSKDGEIEYGFGRSSSLAYGICTVSIGKDIAWPELVEESRKATRRRDMTLRCEGLRELGRLPDTPVPLVKINGEYKDDPAAMAEAQKARDAFCSMIDERLATSGKREAYILIHGFNNTLEDAAFVMTGLWHFLGRQGVPFIYTWPAGCSYAYDRESGEFTVFHLKQFLRGLASCPSVEKIHIVAHSRGTDVALTALRELNIGYKAAGQTGLAELKLGNVVLAAADLDLHVVQQRIAAERIPLMPARMTVYTSPSDHALGAAEILFKGGHRLGDLSPTDLNPVQKKNLANAARLNIVQARVDTGLIGHDYFHSNPAVSSDLLLILRDNKDPGAEHGRPLTKVLENFWTVEEGYLLEKGGK